MLKSRVRAGSVWLSLFALCACKPSTADKAPPAETKKEEPKRPIPPKLKPGSAVCAIDPLQPGFMRRSGKAQVQLIGDGLNIDLHDVVALCGPMFNRDIRVLEVKAGDGLLFETCLPQGTLQIASWSRAAGKQVGHGPTEVGGTEVLFNLNKGASYSSQADATDSIVFSDDFWKASAEVALHSVGGKGALRAKIAFECPAPGPWSDEPPTTAPTQPSP